ncbi:MAG: DUF4166 domain-containing protein [Alphaproteobacteria bacterium]|nr:MAG: DUF4166 domain-containing protein [Alphaproteobacteria bacterium]
MNLRDFQAHDHFDAKQSIINESAPELWFVYDGECPICSYAAHALRIRRDVGTLHLIDARTHADHPLVREITQRGYALDQGMVLKFYSRFYHGADALHMMAMLGSPHGWFNRTNRILFRNPTLAKICYPLMRATRNALLRFKKIPPIDNLLNHDQPLMRSVFGDAVWEQLPPILQAHYNVRPYSDDAVIMHGVLDVHVAPWLARLNRITKTLITQSGEAVPITVRLHGSPQNAHLYFDRTFHFPEGIEHFRSKMQHLGGDLWVEWMRFGFGWTFHLYFDGTQIQLIGRRYVFNLFGFTMPFPMLGWLLGRATASETALSEHEFHMHTHTQHRIFGKVFGYHGSFRV